MFIKKKGEKFGRRRRPGGVHVAEKSRGKRLAGRETSRGRAVALPPPPRPPSFSSSHSLFSLFSYPYSPFPLVPFPPSFSPLLLFLPLPRPPRAIRPQVLTAGGPDAFLTTS